MVSTAPSTLRSFSASAAASCCKRVTKSSVTELAGGWPTPLKNMSQLGWWNFQWENNSHVPVTTNQWTIHHSLTSEVFSSGKIPSKISSMPGQRAQRSTMRVTYETCVLKKTQTLDIPRKSLEKLKRCVFVTSYYFFVNLYCHDFHRS